MTTDHKEPIVSRVDMCLGCGTEWMGLGSTRPEPLLTCIHCPPKSIEQELIDALERFGRKIDLLEARLSRETGDTKS